jgi:hypothetical protein
MFHDLTVLITNNPFGSFIIILAALWACERVVKAFINRNKPPAPECNCECCDEDEEDEED